MQELYIFFITTLKFLCQLAVKYVLTCNCSLRECGQFEANDFVVDNLIRVLKNNFKLCLHETAAL